MTKQQAQNLHHLYRRLSDLGIDSDTADKLLKIERTLQRWFEYECGTENKAGSSISIERDEKTDKPIMRIAYNSQYGYKEHFHPVADREKGARKRLASIMAAYPELRAYIQGDPRGCALYIVKASDVPADGHINQYYTRGVAVCV